MITENTVRDIIGQYERFGWELDHVLLSPALRESFRESLTSLFVAKTIDESDLDAAWFSRLAPNGRIAWELRALTNSPFALLDSAEPEATRSELKELFSRIEDEMRERMIRPVRDQ